MRPAIEELLETVRIGELPRRPVSRVDASTTLAEVYRLLDEERSVAVLVYEGRTMVGIFTERDVVYRTALEGGTQRPVSEVMTGSPVTLSASDRLAEAIRTMSRRRIRHVPLEDSDGEEGMIGGRDVLRLIADYYPESLINLPPRLDQKMRRPEGG